MLKQITKPLKIISTVGFLSAGYILISFSCESTPCESLSCETGDKYCSCWAQTRGGNICVKKAIVPTTKACMKWCEKDPEGSFVTIKDAWDDCSVEESYRIFPVYSMLTKVF